MLEKNKFTFAMKCDIIDNYGVNYERKYESPARMCRATS